MQDLSVTLIQTDLYWESPTANLASLEEKIAIISTQTDLIILPEMFNSGFTMNAKSVAEPMNLTTFKWLRQQSKKANAVVTGSFIVKEGEKYFNRLIWMRPDGRFEQYDKRHLFRMGNEHLTFAAGIQRIIVELKGWKICPLICYDLRFPVWSRQVNSHQATKAQNYVVEQRNKATKAQSGVEEQRNEEAKEQSEEENFRTSNAENRISNTYDLLIYVANWPSARSQVWDILLQARAIENQSYCIGVNRVGNDGMGLNYSGNSAIIDFKGNQTFYQKDSEIIHNQTLSYQELIDFRAKFPAYLDADNFTIEL